MRGGGKWGNRRAVFVVENGPRGVGALAVGSKGALDGGRVTEHNVRHALDDGAFPLASLQGGQKGAARRRQLVGGRGEGLGDRANTGRGAESEFQRNLSARRNCISANLERDHVGHQGLLGLLPFMRQQRLEEHLFRCVF